MDGNSGTTARRGPTDFTFDRYHVDLAAGAVGREHRICEDLEDALGGIARSYKLFADLAATDPYDPELPLVMNIGVLTGTRVMTGLRTYLTGYSPLKACRSGAPAFMWSAGSGNFGPKLRGLGIDEMVLTGRAAQPTLLHLTPGGEGEPARFAFLDASSLVGLPVNERVGRLHERFPGAHFAVIGPAAEHWREVAYAGVYLSTDNQFESGELKVRACGRGGFGGVWGSRNLLAIAADGPNPRGSGAGLREINREINLGPGSARYRDLADDRGGTWRTYKMMHEVGNMPEYNFTPTGSEEGITLYRANVEAGPYAVRAEGCYLCGIRCHKNAYDRDPSGAEGRFRTKVDYEPLVLLGPNLGIFDPDRVFHLIALSDELGMDSISLGVTLGYAMEYNRRHPGSPILGGLAYGDFSATRAAVTAAGEGRLPELGRGAKRLSEQTGETGYAYHSKGVEYPAYLPQTNPGFPWALAGGHMSMRTFFLIVLERETGLDYWVDAITNRGPLYMLDDITGLCKFSNISPEVEAEAIRAAVGLEVTAEDLKQAVWRTYLRGYGNERRQGFVADDYAVPDEAHDGNPNIRFPHFNTREFFAALQERVLATFDQRLAAAGL
jgi:aldehyde:ferredoxin oxidoreductase